MNTITTDLADYVIATLRAHEAELRQAGVRRLSLFGSVARGDAAEDSDIDLAAEFDPSAEMDLIRLVALERELGEALGRHVEILSEPIENPQSAGQRRAGSPRCLLNTTRPTASAISWKMPHGLRAILPDWIGNPSPATIGRGMPWSAVSSACAKLPSGSASKRTSSCRASPGPISAGWGTGCGMLTTG